MDECVNVWSEIPISKRHPSEFGVLINDCKDILWSKLIFFG